MSYDEDQYVGPDITNHPKNNYTGLKQTSIYIHRLFSICCKNNVVSLL